MVMKRIVPVLLAVCVAAGLLGAGMVQAGAAGTDDVIAAIATYNLNHGGTGSLVATVTGPNEVTIIGSVTGVKKGFQLQPGDVSPTTVKWNASLTTNGDAMTLLYFGGNGTLEVVGGSIQAPNAWAIETGAKVVISGGELNCHAIGVDNIIIRGGKLVCNQILSSGTIAIYKGAVFRCTLAGPWADQDYFYAKFLYVEPGADVSTIPPSYINANEDFTELTVIGNFHMRCPTTLRDGQTLTIPIGTSIILDSRLTLDGGTLVLDGHTVPSENSDSGLVLLHGTVLGENAGDMAGTYVDGKKVGPTPWWQPLSPFLQFILRRFLFGWLWMN